VARAASRLIASSLALAAIVAACAGSTEDELARERDLDGSVGKSGEQAGDSSPWPDGPQAGSGGASGSSGSGGSSTGGASGASGSGGSGATGGGSSGGGSSGSGGSGGCSPIVCKNWQSCQNESLCVSSCPPAPSESCNLSDDNCDGQCDEGAGCRAGVHRSFNPSSGEHFYTTSASEAVCCGFNLEFSNFFYLYASSQAGLVPFYRCYLATGMHFYTTSSTCEGAPGTNEGILGYIATSQLCGSTPLHRLSKSSNGDHFYTTSESEKNTAAASYGYVSEGIAGYVWPSG
jgi:hypothetical protein